MSIAAKPTRTVNLSRQNASALCWDGDFVTRRAAGRLGRVLRFESRFSRWRPVPEPKWRLLEAPEEAGGLLFDIGTHIIDQALLLFGRSIPRTQS